MPIYDKFEKGKRYRFGVLKSASQNNSITPEFRNNPRPVTVSGDYLSEIDCKTFEDYLRINPHQYPKSVTISCFVLENDAEGIESMKKVAEGNFYPVIDSKQKDNQTLADATPQQISVKMPDNSKSNKDLINLFNQQIESLQTNNMRLENKLEEFSDKLIKKEEEILNLKAEMSKIQFERDTYQKVLDELKKENNGAGLADSINGIMANPVTQQILGMATMFLQQKFMGGNQGNITQSPGNQNMQDNYDGVSPRPGEFDGNPL
jgi:hypothetical protein